MSINLLTSFSTQAYLIFAQQHFGRKCWGADIIRSGVRCDRYQCSNFAILGENYKYVIVELSADHLSQNAIHFVHFLPRLDNRVRRSHFVNTVKEKKKLYSELQANKFKM